MLLPTIEAETSEENHADYVESGDDEGICAEPQSQMRQDPSYVTEMRSTSKYNTKKK